jgi:NADP-dependent 3-hydroxy acid dehydrogenase YdfG
MDEDRQRFVAFGTASGRGVAELPRQQVRRSRLHGSILRDLREEGIRVTLIEPGEVDTPMQEDELREAEGNLGPTDVADAIVYAVTRLEHVCVNDIQLIPASPLDAD